MKIKNVNISKLNFSLLVSTLILVVLTVILLILLAGRNGHVQGNTDVEPTGSETGSEEKTTAQVPQGSTGESVTYDENDFTEATTEPISTLTFNAGAEGDVASRPTYINANISSVTYWDSGDTACTQFRVVITNVSQSKINNWGIAIEFDKNIELLDYWNANMELKGKNIKITPISVNQKIGTKDEFELGFIISCAQYAVPKSYKVTIGNNIQQINLNQSKPPVNPPATTTPGQTTTRPQPTTTYDRNTTTPKPPMTTTPERTTTTVEEKTTPDDMTTTPEESTGDDESTTTANEDMKKLIK